MVHTLPRSESCRFGRGKQDVTLLWGPSLGTYPFIIPGGAFLPRDRETEDRPDEKACDVNLRFAIRSGLCIFRSVEIAPLLGWVGSHKSGFEQRRQPTRSK